MSKHLNSPRKPERLVFIVGLTIGLSILGDSFLYGNLPIEAENLGIALPLVGILLSANRLVRLVSNTWASSMFEKFGPRKPFIFATILALFTTAVYGVGWGFSVFLLARIGWGIAWSALRQGGYQAVWVSGESSKGKMMGLLWGLIRLGSAFSVLLGGYLRDLWGYRAGVLGVMSVTALAIPVALSIHWPAESQRVISSKQSFWHGWREALKIDEATAFFSPDQFTPASKVFSLPRRLSFWLDGWGRLTFLRGWGSKSVRLQACSWPYAGLRTSSSPRRSAGYRIDWDSEQRSYSLSLSS